ncbi:MAG: hypothetical protein HY399_00500 [Elusimicrobia bacterium]|nr:hypothetical protein [Elusimicrobiota bacterium]
MAHPPAPYSFHGLSVSGMVAVGLGLLTLVLLWMKRRWKIKAVRLREELQRLKSAPLQQEFRIERYDVLWFPVVTAAQGSREVLEIKPGVPHCKACAVPLSSPLGKKEWACSQCGSKFVGSLVDVMVTDSVAQQALKYFQERHPNHRKLVK